MITAVVTCMGRLEHLRMTLPFTLAEFDKVIVVDWSCPDKSGSWAETQGAHVCYAMGERYFDASRARNFGASLVTTEYVAFVDADSVCMPGLGDEVRSLLSRDSMVLSARTDDGRDIPDTVGFIACPTDAFRAVGCYSEEWIGWGSEDLQLRGKLFLDCGLKVKRLAGMSLGAIAHSNEMRNQHRELPIEMTALDGFNKLSEWYVRRGYDSFSTHPDLKDIAFVGASP